MYFHSTVYSQQGDTTLYHLKTSVKTQVLGECQKSLNSLIILNMYAIMSYNTTLSCIINLDTPSITQKAKLQWKDPSHHLQKHPKSLSF